MQTEPHHPPTITEHTESGSENAGNRMHFNLLTLAFSGPTAPLEKAFLDDYNLYSLKHLRITLVLGAVFYAVFGILDHVMMPSHEHLTWLIRYAAVCPATLLMALLTYRPWFKQWMQPLLSALIILGSIGIILMILIAPQPVNHFYYAGLILVLIFSYTFIRARFLWATMTGLIVVTLYEIAVIGFTDIPQSVLTSNNFFLIGANLACMGICYAMEYYARRDFFLVQLLTREQEKVNLANRLLESKVEERTADLIKINRDLEAEITERKRAEEERMRLQHQLKQAERMESIGKLAAGVAHDLNNILVGLVSYPDLLLMDLPEDSPMRQAILTIQQSGKKAGAIVQDMLTLTRQGMMDKRVVNLNTIVDDYLHSPEYRQLHSNHPHVHLDVDLQDDLLSVRGSTVHLSKALMNLVNNAFEANMVNGTVWISTRNIYMDKPVEAYEKIGEGEYAVLSVADTGIGIDAGDVRKIFEPFYTKKKLGRSGTGLGMTMIWSAVKDHEGFLDLQSAEGQGSIFELYFPATRQPLSDGEPPFTLEDVRGTESVLVIDDIPEQRDIATIMLQKLGYRVRAAESGEAAVEYLKKEKADILVLDMIMEPGIDGCETYRRILQDHPGQKAVIASGFSESERVWEAQRLGAGPYIKKPYTLEKIARTLRLELNRPG